MMGYENSLNPPPFSCDDFQRMEDMSLESFKKYSTDASLLDSEASCKSFRGYHVFINPLRSWTDPWNRQVGGYTSCEMLSVYVGNYPWTGGVYPHELAHVSQKCNALMPIDDGLDEAHANWGRDKIINMIGFYQIDAENVAQELGECDQAPSWAGHCDGGVK